LRWRSSVVFELKERELLLAGLFPLLLAELQNIPPISTVSRRFQRCGCSFVIVIPPRAYERYAPPPTAAGLVCDVSVNLAVWFCLTPPCASVVRRGIMPNWQITNSSVVEAPNSSQNRASGALPDAAFCQNLAFQKSDPTPRTTVQPEKRRICRRPWRDL
jgi:hypothetical protein